MHISDTPGKASKPKIEDFDEDSVTLSWDKPKEDGGDRISGYVVEVKEKGTDKWKPINEKNPCKDTKFTGKLISLATFVLTCLKLVCAHCSFMMFIYITRPFHSLSFAGVLSYFRVDIYHVKVMQFVWKKWFLPWNDMYFNILIAFYRIDFP